jgi:YVTN family beta-propeller protein
VAPRLFGVVALSVILVSSALAGQVPGPAGGPDLGISPRDRVYAAEQFSNTVSVIDPSTNTLLGEIRLGEPPPANLSPLYRGQLLVHGLRDGTGLVVAPVTDDKMGAPVQVQE